MPTIKYLTHYPEPLQAQVRALIAENRLGEVLQQRYHEPNTVRTDEGLQEHTLAQDAEHDERDSVTDRCCRVKPCAVR